MHTTRSPQYAPDPRQARRARLRRARRRDRHRAAAPQRRRARDRRAAVGHARARRGVLRRARRAPRLRRGRLRRHLDEHVGLPSALLRRRRAAVELDGARALDGPRAARPAPRAPGGRRRRARATSCAVAFSINGDVDSAEGESTIRLLARLFADEPPDLILLETLTRRAAVAVCHGAVAARHRASGLAVVPALPARAVQRLRAALGRARGRRLRPRGGPLRADGHRRADGQLHPARPRRRDGVLPARLHRPAARRRIRTSATTPTRAGASSRASAAPSTRRWRCAGARRERRSSAAAAASAPPRRGGARAARADRARRPARPERPAAGADAAAGARAAPAPARGPTAGGARCSRCAFPDLVADAGVVAPSSGSLMAWRHLYDAGDRRAPALPGRRLRHGHPRHPARAQRRVARARDRHRRARRAQHRLQRPIATASASA